MFSKSAAEEYDDFVKAFNDPYGEKEEETKRLEKFANLRANADKRIWSSQNETDTFLDEFNRASNERRVKFPNTQLQTKPQDYGLRFPNTQLRSAPINLNLKFPNTQFQAKPQDYDVFPEGFNDLYGQKEKEEQSKTQILPKRNNSQSLHNADTNENYRDANLWDLIVNSAKKGYYNDQFGEELYKQMMGQKNDAEKYQNILDGEDYRFNNDNIIEKGISNFFEDRGKEFRRIKTKDAINMVTAGALGGAGLALAAGQLGPQVLVPEEALTIPSATIIGAKVGFDSMNMVADRRVGGGHTYKEMLDAGVSPDTARRFAMGTEFVNGGIDFITDEEIIKAINLFSSKNEKGDLLEILFEELLKRKIDKEKEQTQDRIREKGVEYAIERDFRQ